MKKILLLAIASTFLLQASLSAAKPNTLTKKEKEAGWQLLFDGKTMEHFRNYQKKDVSDGWVVKNGAMVRNGKGAGDIITRKQYDSFELSLEYNISKAGNSGLMFHVTEEENTPWKTGAEIQIQDNVDGHDPQKSGWLYQLYPAKVDATKPVGEWNELRILITPAKCEQYMNGTKYCEYVKGSDDWNKRVAASKFGKMPKFGKATKGHIALQDHGDMVKYRNVKIRVVK
ncbi:MAG: glycosyl hydrolase [Blastopirellula sp.]|nr:MAG: glycosyl hydrolase [Blastopirellula sp.]